MNDVFWIGDAALAIVMRPLRRRLVAGSFWSDGMSAPTFGLTFPHTWQVEVLPARPVILPARHYVYPREVEEIERGALEVLVRPDEPGSMPFLATCALGFRDPVVPTGIWSTPNPRQMCAVSGGYAYIIDTAAPEHFAMLLVSASASGASDRASRSTSFCRASLDSGLEYGGRGVGDGEVVG